MTNLNIKKNTYRDPGKIRLRKSIKQEEKKKIAKRKKRKQKTTDNRIIVSKQGKYKKFNNCQLPGYIPWRDGFHRHNSGQTCVSAFHSK